MSDPRLKQAYFRRDHDPAVAARDSLLSPATVRMLAQRQVVMWSLLAEVGWTPSNIGHRRVLEIGCGDGGNLLDLIRGGCSPGNLTGVELLPERAAMARSRLPAACTVTEGDFTQRAAEHTGQDLIVCFTVMSSLLNEADRERLAAAAWRQLAPGGVVLLYDFIVDNPRNPDVKGVKPDSFSRWWPQAQRIVLRRLTLAPPLARRLGWATPWAYGLLAALPGLCLHRMVAVVKGT